MYSVQNTIEATYNHIPMYGVAIFCSVDVVIFFLLVVVAFFVLNFLMCRLFRLVYNILIALFSFLFCAEFQCKFWYSFFFIVLGVCICTRYIKHTTRTYNQTSNSSSQQHTIKNEYNIKYIAQPKYQIDSKEMCKKKNEKQKRRKKFI